MKTFRGHSFLQKNTPKQLLYVTNNNTTSLNLKDEYNRKTNEQWLIDKFKFKKKKIMLVFLRDDLPIQGSPSLMIYCESFCEKIANEKDLRQFATA